MILIDINKNFNAIIEIVIFKFISDFHLKYVIFPLLSFNVMQFLLGTRRYFLRFRNILEMIACGGKEKKVNLKASNCLYIKVPQRTCLPWQPLTWMTFLTRFNFNQFMYRTKKEYYILILTQQMLTEYRKLYNKSI